MQPEYENIAVEPKAADTEDGPSLTPNQKRFYASERCTDARESLQRLVDSTAHNTDSSYFRESALAFVERHLQYLSTHPLVDVNGYISNVRLMTSMKQR